MGWQCLPSCLEQADFQAAIVRALQAAEFVGEAQELFESLGAILQGGKTFQFFGKFLDQAFLDGRVEFAHAGKIRGELVEALAAVLFLKPILKSAVPPLGQVLFRDRPAGEAFGEDALHVRQSVQPRDEVFAKRAIKQAAI